MDNHQNPAYQGRPRWALPSRAVVLASTLPLRPQRSGDRIVGNDYVWPHGTARAARVYAELCEGLICHEVFAPLGCRSWKSIIDGVERSRPDAVIMLLVGEDAVHFNRAFAAASLDARCWRLSTLIDENTLVGSGAESTRRICSAAAYFETLTTPESLDFGWRYTRRFGPEAPTLNSVGESCYEGVLLLSALARRAGSLDVRRMTAVADTLSYGGPRGEVRMRERHLDQRIYLAEANELQFDIVTQL